MSLHEKGFTMIELLFVIVLGTFLTAAIYVATETAMRSSAGLQEKVEAVQDVKASLNTMAIEIAMASYKPTIIADSSLWKDITNPGGQNCTISAATTPNAANKGIREATANSITVEADLNGSETIDAANEVIRYVYVSAGGEAYITRCAFGSNGSAATAFLGDTVASGAAQRTVRVINSTLGLNVFRYFDANGADITAGVIAAPNVNIQNIRRIDITIAVETANIDPSTGQRRRIVYSTSVIPVNHSTS